MAFSETVEKIARAAYAVTDAYLCGGGQYTDWDSDICATTRCQIEHAVRHFIDNPNDDPYAYHARWKPIELRAREAMQEAQYASFFLPGIPEKDPNTGGWRFDVLAVYRDIKISMGYVLVSKEKEVTVKLKDKWKGFFLENHILWLYKNSAAFFPG